MIFFALFFLDLGVTTLRLALGVDLVIGLPRIWAGGRDLGRRQKTDFKVV